ncbi:glycosyltransferase family 4 protein [Frankia sp. CiP3]|uniref:glycosyltransferase family 4 protein n=1 Tax=Frankia sp. CiP3 TaxID=2880971 RepID=UPI001EF6424A|nr:glycosyltransferase family 4 protein [Frankia sp. CiP3]
MSTPTAVTDTPARMPREPARCRLLVVEQGEGLWGAQRYLLRLAPLLRDRGVEQILAAPAGSATAAAWRAAGLLHVVLPAPDDRGIRAPDGRLSPVGAVREFGRTAMLARRTAALVRLLDVDAVHANSHWSHLQCVLAGRLTNRPVVLHLHEENEPDLIGRLRGLAVRGAQASVAVSGAVAASLPPAAARRTQVIRNGVDTDALRPGPADPAVRAQLAADPSAPVVLALSRLDPRKGVDNVIRAVASLPGRFARTQLAVAGAPSLDPAHARTLRELGASLLGVRIRFLGPRTDIADLLRACDALVLASSLEGLPLSVLEAQACGTPVVAFPTAGIPEIVTDGVTGLLARAGDVDDLTRRLTDLLGNPDYAERISIAARANVLARHTLTQQADSQAELLRSLMAARQPGPAIPGGGGHRYPVVTPENTRA